MLKPLSTGDMNRAVRQATQNQALRDEIAMRAMGGILASGKQVTHNHLPNAQFGELLARNAYDMADHMLTERARRMMQNQAMKEPS